MLKLTIRAIHYGLTYVRDEVEMIRFYKKFLSSVNIYYDIERNINKFNIITPSYKYMIHSKSKLFVLKYNAY